MSFVCVCVCDQKLYFSLWKEQRCKKWETLAPAPELAFEVGGAYLDMFWHISSSTTPLGMDCAVTPPMWGGSC